MENSQGKQGEPDCRTVILTAPPEIYLQVSDEPSDNDEPFPYRTREISWCEDSVFDCEVRYVRADLAISAPAVPEGWQIVQRDIHPLDHTPDASALIDLLRNPPSAESFDDEFGYYNHWWHLLLSAAPKGENE